MSVLIKGMEMPTSCYKCPMRQKNGMDLVCPIVHERFSVADVNILEYRLDNCPLVPVQARGRLIDAAARVNVQLYNDEFEDYQTVNMSIDDLLDSSWIELEDDPTIIQAEPFNNLSKPCKEEGSK